MPYSTRGKNPNPEDCPGCGEPINIHLSPANAQASNPKAIAYKPATGCYLKRAALQDLTRTEIAAGTRRPDGVRHYDPATGKRLLVAPKVDVPEALDLPEEL